jgi:hypothetical protein
MRGVKWHCSIVYMVALVLAIFADQTCANSAFVRVSLGNGVSAELPKNWTVVSANRRITLSAWNEAMLESAKLSDAPNEMPFTAQYFDDSKRLAGTLAIRFYPTITITESEAVAGGDRFVGELDRGVRSTFTRDYEVSGGTVLAWHGTRRILINGATYFVSRNDQLSPKGEKFHGMLVRHLNASNSFTVLISYRLDQKFFLEPIVEKVIRSIRK